MNGSKKKEEEVEKMLGFYFEYYECVVIFFRFICNCGHHFQCMGASVWKLLEACKLMSLRKRGTTTLGTFENRKKFVWMLKKQSIYFNFFLSSGFIYISVLYVRQAKIRDLRCDVRASPTEVS